MKKDIDIPKKNYIIVCVVSIVVIVLALYVRSFYLNYQDNLMKNGVFYNKAINQIETNDFDYALAETNEVILYVGYNGDRDIARMEKRLYRKIESLKLNDKVLYWNVTSLMENNEYLTMLRSKFPSVEIDINKAPMLLYIKDGVCLEVIDSSKELVNSDSFEKLINKYGIK